MQQREDNDATASQSLLASFGLLSLASDPRALLVQEAGPLGGPKYYVATTKEVQAWVVHEAMPPRAGADADVDEEKGYEILDRDLMPSQLEREYDDRLWKEISRRGKSRRMLLKDGESVLEEATRSKFWKEIGRRGKSRRMLLQDGESVPEEATRSKLVPKSSAIRRKRSRTSKKVAAAAHKQQAERLATEAREDDDVSRGSF